MSETLPEQWDRIAMMRERRQQPDAMGKSPVSLERILKQVEGLELLFGDYLTLNTTYLRTLAHYGLKMHEQGRPEGREDGLVAFGGRHQDQESGESVESLRAYIRELEDDRRALSGYGCKACGECDTPYDANTHADCPHCGEG